MKVIVAITTYNLEQYISQALDSVLMQKTNFEYKIRVADDCSTDRTPEILRDYQNKYPNKIEVLYAEKNMGSLANSNRVLDFIDSDYFSFLDGDDYWIGENHLQSQVDFLDSHPEYSMCGANTQFLRNGKLADCMLDNRMLGKTFSFDDYVKSRMPHIVHTSTLLFRNSIFKKGLPSVFKDLVGTFEECAVRGEDFRRLIHLQTGPIYVADKTISVYRIHKDGMWQGIPQLKRNIEIVITNNFYRKYFGQNYGLHFEKKFQGAFNSLMDYIISNSIIFNLQNISEREGFLLGSLITDVSRGNVQTMRYKNHNFKMFVIKALRRINWL